MKKTEFMKVISRTDYKVVPCYEIIHGVKPPDNRRYLSYLDFTGEPFYPKENKKLQVFNTNL